MTYHETKLEIASLKARIEGYENVLMPKYLGENLDKALELQKRIDKLLLDVQIKEEFIQNCKKLSA